MLLLMAMTLVVMACTGVEDMAGTPEQERSAQQLPVAFSAYVNRSTTRGGATGQLTTDGTGGTTTSLRTEGFGVFGYYTGSRQYNQMSLPNFMYNQQVTYNGTSENWEYTPIKYWPNENGTNGSQNTDYLTFFAYAPYAEVDGATGCVATNPQSGIVALTRVKDSGDPLVSYYASFNPSECVDLCWAAPLLDQKRPDNIGEKETFNFHHALAALNVQIDADVDVVSHATSSLDGKTRIWVRSVTFEGFATKGQLNLNNSASIPHWYGLGCDCDLTSTPITIYDGRNNRHEGIAQALNERPTGLNPELVQSVPYTVTPTFSSTTTGVTTSLVNLFSSSAIDAPIYVIPTNDPLRVTIEYDVETYDPKLTSQYLSDGRTHGSTIENSISAYITNGTTPIVMEAGKQYTLNLHLGVASVKMNASVTPWADDIDVDVNVPE
jgi:hypothetical protein